MGRYGDYIASAACAAGNHDGCQGPAVRVCQCQCHASRTTFWTRLRRALAGRW